MKITQIRNATLIIEYAGKKFLIDPLCQWKHNLVLKTALCFQIKKPVICFHSNVRVLSKSSPKLAIKIKTGTILKKAVRR
ncbi:MAG: hypothetical protein C0442_10600 [Chlorobiaceae bacterium]|nr:hypothetical protein [Chlorobiaceae bacterium]